MLIRNCSPPALGDPDPQRSGWYSSLFSPPARPRVPVATSYHPTIRDDPGRTDDAAVFMPAQLSLAWVQSGDLAFHDYAHDPVGDGFDAVLIHPMLFG